MAQLTNTTVNGDINVTGEINASKVKLQSGTSSQAIMADGTLTTLSAVASSGSYNDLTNKPTIPAAANSGILQISSNSSSAVNTLFNANSSSATNAIKFIQSGATTVTAAAASGSNPATVTITSTDNKVQQDLGTGDTYYPIISSPTANKTSGSETSTVLYHPALMVNPSKMSVAEGSGTTASANYSHAGGLGTVANQEAMTAIGRYNEIGTTGALFVIGNGEGDPGRKNVVAVTVPNAGWNCTVNVTGKVLAYEGFSTRVLTQSSTGMLTTALDPNIFYDFGEMSSLSISLRSGVTGYTDEYMFQFTASSSGTTLTVPSTVTWLKDPDIKPNKTYQVSIMNNLGIIGEW